MLSSVFYRVNFSCSSQFQPQHEKEVTANQDIFYVCTHRVFFFTTPPPPKLLSM